MRRCVRSSLTVAVAAVAVVVVRTPVHADGAHRPPGRRELTLPAAIEIALSGNPQLAMEAETIAAADARTRSDAALRLPLLGVKANALFWDRRIEADLGPDIGKVTIRDRFTGTVDFSVSQPLSGALAIGRLVERDRAIAGAARAEREGRRIEIAYQTAAAYLDALQARTLGQVARSTLIQLDGDLQHARVLLAGGTLQKVDVLRLEVEHARVEQQGLGAETSALAARRRLALLLGLPDGTELELAGVDTAPPALPWTEDEAVARAHSGRAEARAAASSSHAAELDIAVARASYYPAVSLVGIYSHAINTGLLGSADSAYAGVTLDWNLWDWGKRGADVDASRALSRKARLAQVALGEQIAVDTRARWQAARLARATLEVADRGRVAAVEAQRLQAARFAQGAATTIEVLDAETALANAEAQAVIGRYQYLVAWMALGREVGMLPAPPAAGDGRGAP